ncbi:CvpA family protein [Candidatus Cytomitobacter indipagum]|uniref:CvpA family protein n=1 Tax=Candidatus Cytomitobacter indipagum TaxID=2601575 RepID=A0A5C0UEF3_9PROT|nr:CvpA family protein [Candidatus Cytomitobacter indipagum]QEK38087.1 CvpA family protein [Candidatus Cytomitobacter indipagum]
MFECCKSADLIVLLISSYFLISGFARGFFAEILRTISVLISFAIPMFYSVRFCAYKNKFENLFTRYSLLFAAPLLLFFVVGYILLGISHKLASWIRKSRVSILDRMLGIAFGAVKAFLFFVIATSLVNEFYPEFTQYVENSRSYQFFTSDHSMILYSKDLMFKLYDLLRALIVNLIDKCII